MRQALGGLLLGVFVQCSGSKSGCSSHGWVYSLKMLSTFGGRMADSVALGPLNTANMQRAATDKSLAIKQVEQSFDAASKRAVDTSLDAGIEVLLSDRPAASVDPTYEKLGPQARRNG